MPTLSTLPWQIHRSTASDPSHLYAHVWKPEAELMLDRIGIQPHWRCIDLGCSDIGMLNVLSQRVGTRGHVMGVVADDRQLSPARHFVQAHALDNVHITSRDRHATPQALFDLSHVQVDFAPLGRKAALLHDLVAFTKPGGVVAIQESDIMSWNCYPTNPTWDALKTVILSAFKGDSSDVEVGQHPFNVLRRLGLEDVQIRASVMAFQATHPCKRLPIQLAVLLRERIIDMGLMQAAELDRAIATCERVTTNPDTVVVSFILTQVWGHKPI